MKLYRNLLFAFGVSFTALVVVVHTSCQKNPTCSNVCLNGSYCENGACRCPSGYYGVQCQYTKIIYYNNTFTNVCVKLFRKYGTSMPSGYPNKPDTTIYIKPSATASFYGVPYVPGVPQTVGDTAIAIMYTFGPYGPTRPSSDTIFGEVIYFDTLKTAFLNSGNVNVAINVSADYFFVQARNNQAAPIGTWNLVSFQINSGISGYIPNTLQPFNYAGNYTVKNNDTVQNVGYFGSSYGSTVSSTDVQGNVVSKVCNLQFSMNQSYLYIVP